MAGKINVNVVVLWDHEIKAAVRALHNLTTDDVSEDDYRFALQACMAALYHKDILDDAPLTIISGTKPEHMNSSDSA